MGRPLQELYRIYEADDLDGANQALGRFADLYATGQIPEYHDIVDTIIAWGEGNTRLLHQQTGIQRTHRRNQQPPPESYDELPTGSPTLTITQPAESS